MKQDFDQYIERRGTFCTQWDYIADRFGVGDLLPFTISDTDFAVPSAIMAALHKRLEHPVFGYSRWNHSEFTGAVTGWYARRYTCPVAEETVIYSPAVLFSLALLLEIFCEHGDEVIVQTPSYFLQPIPACGCKLSLNNLLRENGKYSIDYADLEEKARTAKVLVWCNPHNPTGRVWTMEETAEVVRICRKYDVKIISDEIHADIVYAPYKFVSMAHFAGDDIAIITSASKTFNIPALTGSYGFIFSSKLREKFLGLLKQKYCLSSPSILGIHAHIAAYRECDEWVDDLVKYLVGNMQFIADYIAREGLKISFVKPEGTYLAWLDVAGLGMSDEEIKKRLVEKGKAAIMSGTTYGHNSFLRLNAGCPRSKLEDGLQRMNAALS